MRISLVLAVAENGVIGRGGDLPWHLPKDLRHFKRLTLGHTLVMGRRTWESIGRPLPGRRSVVLTRDPGWTAPGFSPPEVTVAHDLDRALALAEELERAAVEEEAREVFVIGGAAVFATALPRAARIHLTLVHAAVEGDVVLPPDLPCPPWDERQWRLLDDEPHPADARHAHAFSFRTYERVQEDTDTASDVLTCGEIGREALAELLGRYGLELVIEPDGASLPGSYWGAPEAGLVGNRVYVREDTPVHSLLHESCHVICMDEERRQSLHTDAGEDFVHGDVEESAVCYLQVLLGDEIPGSSSERIMADMDRWGYSFRLGSTRAWLEEDAEDAREFLEHHGLIDADGRPTWKLRR